MNTYHSTKTDKRKVYTVQFGAALLMFIFGILLALNGKAQETNKQQSNFYAITGKGLKDTSWLFGTYHLVKNSYLDEVPAVMHAFIRAQGIAVEMVLDSTKLPVATAMGLLKDKTLTDLLDGPFKDSLDTELKNTLGVGIAQINQLKPINVAITLALVYIVTDRKSLLQKYTGVPLDGYFAQTGKLAGKKITEFETIEEQMNILFNSSTNEQQVNQLKLFLRNKADMINQGNQLIENWFKHDLDKMYAVSEKGLEVFGNENEFLKKRNDKWMQTIPGLMKEESQFIAVGALHLAGPHGLIKHLQQLGYTLTPIKL